MLILCYTLYMKYLTLIMCLFFVGCATNSPGTRVWLDSQLAEIEESYSSGEISKAEYLQLKIDANQVRATRKSKSSNYTYVQPVQSNY